jgi:hypothetical protein
VAGIAVCSRADCDLWQGLRTAVGQIGNQGRGECDLMESVERWGTYEFALEGPADGNPFVDVVFGARFRCGHRAVDVDGFYDGDGLYRVRFMPDTVGEWSFETRSNRSRLSGIAGEFRCICPSERNHGPVRVRDTQHFMYEDGFRYIPVGTTCYAWTHQGDALEEQTLATLKASPFNKIRMCVFPKDYDFNKNEPPCHAFEGSPETGLGYTRFNPVYFRRLEKRVGDLRDLGIEADIILFHPYDRWGYATMDAATDERYLRYVVARLAAFRSVWWSLANEYDLMKAKTVNDWDRFFRIIQECDPYQHLRSVHNWQDWPNFYDHGKPWVTHCSIQTNHVEKVGEWVRLYRKPVVVDECRYEGNIPHRWGSITAQEMVHRFWEGFIRGGYVGHGETYMHPEDILWWSKGGVLHGESPLRIGFLRMIFEEAPESGLWPVESSRELMLADRDKTYILVYFGMEQSVQKRIALPEGERYKLEIIDTWNMTVTPIDGEFSGTTTVQLPGRPHTAVRARKCGGVYKAP